jgi:biotin synthase
MSLQEPKTVQLHRPTAAIKLPEAATWPLEDVMALYELPFNELMFRAQEAHRAHWPDGDVELATLLSIKTGGCEEDCGYCPQAARYDTGVEAKKILDLDTVLDAAKQAKDNGATRFCMGAAWRSPKERDMEKVENMVREVKAMGLETCATLGMLEAEQAQRLKDAGLDYYNHNLDTSP